MDADATTQPVDPEQEEDTRMVRDMPPERLSRREYEVAALVADGLSNRQIAARLAIAEGTAQRHVANIMAKLGSQSRSEVAAWNARLSFG